MGVYSRLNRPILVVDHDPKWLLLFEQEKEKLTAVLGNGVTLLEHIGSTAVPGLAAKPVVDIAIGIHSLAKARSYISHIKRLGYVYEPVLEQAISERRFFWKGTATVHTYHIHMAESDAAVLTRPIMFRDYLREHPEAAREYGDLKRELAKECGQDMSAYVAGKTAFIEQIMRQAERISAKPNVAENV